MIAFSVVTILTAVDTEEQEILRIELEVEPQSAIPGMTRAENSSTRQCCVLRVVLEEHTRRRCSCDDDHLPCG